MAMSSESELSDSSSSTSVSSESVSKSSATARRCTKVASSSKRKNEITSVGERASTRRRRQCNQENEVSTGGNVDHECSLKSVVESLKKAKNWNHIAKLIQDVSLLNQALTTLSNSDDDWKEELWKSLHDGVNKDLKQMCESEPCIRNDKEAENLKNLSKLIYHCVENCGKKHIIPNKLWTLSYAISDLMFKLPDDYAGTLGPVIGNAVEILYDRVPTEDPRRHLLSNAVCVYVIARSLRPNATKNEIIRASKWKSSLQSLSLEGDSSRLMGRLKRLVCVRLEGGKLLSMKEGRQVLICCYLVNRSLSEAIFEKVVEMISSKSSVLKEESFVGLLLYEGYKINRKLVEGHVQKLIEYSLLCDVDEAIKYRKCLEPFYSRMGDVNVNEMVVRLSEPLYWRHSGVANWKVRFNCVFHMQEVFPLAEPESDDYESQLHRSHDTLLKFAEDVHPDVRRVGAYTICDCLARFWEIIVPEKCKALLQMIFEKCLCDETSQQVRLASMDGISRILDNPVSHAGMRPLLCCLTPYLHDTSMLVRESFAKLLLKLHSTSFSSPLAISDVTSIPDLTNRLIHEHTQAILKQAHQRLRTRRNGLGDSGVEGRQNNSNSLVTLLANLLGKSVFVNRSDIVDQLQRFMFLADNCPAGLIAMARGISKDQVNLINRCRLAAGLLLQLQRQTKECKDTNAINRHLLRFGCMLSAAKGLVKTRIGENRSDADINVCLEHITEKGKPELFDMLYKIPSLLSLLLELIFQAELPSSHFPILYVALQKIVKNPSSRLETSQNSLEALLLTKGVRKIALALALHWEVLTESFILSTLLPSLKQVFSDSPEATKKSMPSVAILSWACEVPVVEKWLVCGDFGSAVAAEMRDLISTHLLQYIQSYKKKLKKKPPTPLFALLAQNTIALAGYLLALRGVGIEPVEAAIDAAEKHLAFEASFWELFIPRALLEVASLTFKLETDKLRKSPKVVASLRLFLSFSRAFLLKDPKSPWTQYVGATTWTAASRVLNSLFEADAVNDLFGDVFEILEVLLLLPCPEFCIAEARALARGCVKAAEGHRDFSEIKSHFILDNFCGHHKLGEKKAALVGQILHEIF